MCRIVIYSRNLWLDKLPNQVGGKRDRQFCVFASGKKDPLSDGSIGRLLARQNAVTRGRKEARKEGEEQKRAKDADKVKKGLKPLASKVAIVSFRFPSIPSKAEEPKPTESIDKPVPENVFDLFLRFFQSEKKKKK